MRLSQLARQYDISVQEIIEYLKSLGMVPHSEHPNAKLDEALAELVNQHFGKNEVSTEKGDIEEEVINEQHESDDVPESSVNAALEEVSALETNEIDSARLLEMLENEETVDLTTITRIKAPKKALSGLKVVGKIDLPEPKPKSSEEETKERRGRKFDERPRLSDEEREKRRLNAKRKKEEYEARQERRRQEKERRDKKARKEAHYRQKLSQPVTTQKARKRAHVPIKTTTSASSVRPEARTLWGRFKRWLDGE